MREKGHLCKGGGVLCDGGGCLAKGWEGRVLGTQTPTHGGGAAVLVTVGEQLVQDDSEAPDVRLAREDVV